MTLHSPGDSSDLEQRWLALPRPEGDRLSAERLRDWAGGAVLVAIDSTGQRHLLVRIPEGRPARMPAPVSGLTVTYRRLQPPGEPDGAWLDLAASDHPEARRPFGGLCADVAAELPGSGTPTPHTLFAIIERWRRFWTGQRGPLSAEQQLGLFGELWFVLEWLPPLTEDILTSWHGPLGGRHDFVTETTSVETKTIGARTGPMVHRITSLDQLDEPGQGALYLFSLRASADPLGHYTLGGLIERTAEAAQRTGPGCVILLDERLARLGLSTGDADLYTSTITIVEQQLHLVGPGFPRITRANFPEQLPAGVFDVTYSLDTAACRPWLITTQPDRDNPLFDDR